MNFPFHVVMATTEITGAEGVFLAGNNHVEISPEFDHPQLQLLSVNDLVLTSSDLVLTVAFLS